MLLPTKEEADTMVRILDKLKEVMGAAATIYISVNRTGWGPWRVEDWSFNVTPKQEGK